MTPPRIEPMSPGHLANTQSTRPMSRLTKLAHDIRKHLTTVSTFLDLISCVYRDLSLWRSNQQPRNAEAKTLPLNHQLLCSAFSQVSRQQKKSERSITTGQTLDIDIEIKKSKLRIRKIKVITVKIEKFGIVSKNLDKKLDELEIRKKKLKPPQLKSTRTL